MTKDSKEKITPIHKLHMYCRLQEWTTDEAQFNLLLAAHSLSIDDEAFVESVKQIFNVLNLERSAQMIPDDTELITNEKDN